METIENAESGLLESRVRWLEHKVGEIRLRQRISSDTRDEQIEECNDLFSCVDSLINRVEKLEKEVFDEIN